MDGVAAGGPQRDLAAGSGLDPVRRRYRDLTVTAPGCPVYRVRYHRDVPMFEGDPTPFVELEDFEFGVFLRNLLGDPERMERIFRAEP
ncbi:hypothetical protein GCM10010201_21180 [Pilimelia columellifera subsp. columellifera]|uniref:Uncharacterized protein n=1 Tax=Pilimelia columellifera subsp. columellifera TaxID=706583 RepID=A0ABN3NHX6_9ACTN